MPALNLWPHQQRGLEELDSAIKDGDKNICFTSPTGGGKSRCLFAHILSHRCQTAVYTDRKMLMEQLEKGLTSHGIEYGLRASGHKPRLLDDIQLCMVQTEASRTLSGNREIHAADYIYIDEAHKNGGDSVQQLIAKHREIKPGCVIVGLTATPLGIGHIYERLIVAGTNSELRQCGALVPAYHYGPDEPDMKWIGKVKIDEGECGIPNARRMEFAHRVFGRVTEFYGKLNPDRRPAILFAPGVRESMWFAKTLTESGIASAHIDGSNVWIDGEEHRNDPALREEIAERHKQGEIKVVCNRFVLREGISWEWIYHGIFATIFGSLTSYIQAGGRTLRSHPSMDHVVIQDHGANWWRHGSLNADREWDLGYDDRIVSGLREQRIRQNKEREPITCPRCYAVRLHGDECQECGYRHTTKARIVLQKDGSLREMKGDIFRKRRFLSHDERIEQEWVSRVRAVRKSQKETVKSMTFAQIEANFAREHQWCYPPRTLPMMPVDDADWFRPARDIPIESLTKTREELFV